MIHNLFSVAGNIVTVAMLVMDLSVIQLRWWERPSMRVRNDLIVLPQQSVHERDNLATNTPYDPSSASVGVSALVKGTFAGHQTLIEFCPLRVCANRAPGDQIECPFCRAISSVSE